jgi:flavodoxin
MKSLVVYYTRTGATEKVALDIAERLGSEVEKILDLKKRKGLFGFLSGGKDSVGKKLTQIDTLKKDPEKYDVIIVGTPVWAGTMAPAIRTYLNIHHPKKAAFFCTCGNSSGRAFPDMLELAVDTKLKGELSLTAKELKQDYSRKVDEFVEKIKK